MAASDTFSQTLLLLQFYKRFQIWGLGFAVIVFGESPVSIGFMWLYSYLPVAASGSQGGVGHSTWVAGVQRKTDDQQVYHLKCILF